MVAKTFATCEKVSQAAAQALADAKAYTDSKLSTGTTELADGTTILGTGTAANKFRVANPLPSGGSAGQVPTKQSDGSVIWVTPASGGSGTTEVADGTTILGVGTTADKFRVANPLPSGGTEGQVLTAHSDGSKTWETPASSSSSASAVSFFFGLL